MYLEFKKLSPQRALKWEQEKREIKDITYKVWGADLHWQLT